MDGRPRDQTTLAMLVALAAINCVTWSFALGYLVAYFRTIGP